MTDMLPLSLVNYGLSAKYQHPKILAPAHRCKLVRFGDVHFAGKPVHLDELDVIGVNPLYHGTLEVCLPNHDRAYISWDSDWLVECYSPLGDLVQTIDSSFLRPYLHN